MEQVKLLSSVYLLGFLGITLNLFFVPAPVFSLDPFQRFGGPHGGGELDSIIGAKEKSLQKKDISTENKTIKGEKTIRNLEKKSKENETNRIIEHPPGGPSDAGPHVGP